MHLPYLAEFATPFLKNILTVEHPVNLFFLLKFINDRL